MAVFTGYLNRENPIFGEIWFFFLNFSLSSHYISVKQLMSKQEAIFQSRVLNIVYFTLIVHNISSKAFTELST